MRKKLLGGKGCFYKAQLHVHTIVSDGSYSPEMVKEMYKAEGYSIVAYTDHEVLVPHNDLTDEDFLAITAYEQSVNERYDGTDFQFLKAYHFNFYSKDKNRSWSPCFSEKCMWMDKFYKYVTEKQRTIDYPIVYTTEQVNDMIKKAAEHGFLVSYNHPVWSQQSYPDYIDLENLWGIEIYNHGAAIEGLVDTDTPFDNLLKRGKRIVPIASDDMHDKNHAFGGFSMIEAKRLDYQSVFQAMEEKRLYSSTGPLFEEVSLDENKLTVRCSEVVAIFVNSERRWHKAKLGVDIIEAVFDISEWKKMNEEAAKRGTKVFEPFLRVTIIDKQGKKAWTRAYFEDEL